ncbi:riboflavin synthase [Schizosaccharomyces japonicus yFS275]|uniref:Riboflavin synthase n=1 Tax=Schizosaccharomyces japonicus (strain yFS275 / FY16936) TaxID=402676 RepID=B6K2M4_SCHJY|nr:riboflavin synthase [Schizosaccharomyces japonicus yFS275]EEB07405.1 riboflavin synthase [Schizosaccharomyces japonicus yFS275]
MFTGLVETVGTVISLEKTSEGTIIAIEAPEVLADAHDGDSIAVNGTCLTILNFTSTTFSVGAAPETLRLTNLGFLKKGDKVNLERAILATTRLGGHMVQGHVDTVAEIVEKKPDGEAITFTFKPRDAFVLKYIVYKGYICLDGISLTITNVDETTFSIMMIYYTQSKVALSEKSIGDLVNVEVDQVGKYVEKIVAAHVEDFKKKF